VALALHESLDTDNQRLAEKLDEFGKQNVPDYHTKLEAALDSRVRVQSLTPTALARLASESPKMWSRLSVPKRRSRASWSIPRPQR